MRRKTRKNALILALGLLVVLFVVPVSARASSAPWGLSEYPYRLELRISFVERVLDDFQVPVTLNTEKLIEEGKMRHGCSDIRFTDSDGTTKLHYWLEYGCGAASTKVWVRVPHTPKNTPISIYLYSGYQDAQGESDIFTTMDEGLRAVYYYPGNSAGLDWAHYGGDCADINLDHVWSLQPDISGCPQFSLPQNFRITWSGWVVNKGEGAHAVHVTADSKGFLSLAGSQVLSWDDGTTAAATERSQTVSFSRPIAVELKWYKIKQTGGTISLGWTPADGSAKTKPIPQYYFRSNRRASNAKIDSNYNPAPIVSSLNWESYQQHAAHAGNGSHVSSSTPASSSGTSSQTVLAQTYQSVGGIFTKKIRNITAPNGNDYYTEVTAGDVARFTLALNSMALYHNTKIVDVLPAYTAFIGANGGGAYDQNTNSVSWALGAVAQPDVSYYYDVRILPAPKDGEHVSNVALMTSSQANITSNQAEFVIGSPQVVLEKIPVYPPQQGVTVTYKLAWKNTGSRPAKLDIIETFEAPLAFHSASVVQHRQNDATVSFEVLDIPPRGHGEITVNMAAPAGESYKTPTTKGIYFDNHGYRYPEIILGGYSSGAAVSAPAERQGQVRGAIDVRAGSNDAIAATLLLGFLLAASWYFLRETGASSLRLAWRLYRERQK